MSARRQNKQVSFGSFDQGSSFSNVRLNTQRQPAEKETSPHRPYKYIRQYQTQRQNIAPNASLSPVVAIKDIHTVEFLQLEVKRLEDVIFYVGTNNDKLLIQCDEQQKEIAYLKICSQRAKEEYDAELRKMKEIIKDKASECESVANNAKREKEIMERESERIKQQIKQVIEKKNNELFRLGQDKEAALRQCRETLERQITELRDNHKEELDRHRFQVQRLEEDVLSWKQKYDSLQAEYNGLQEKVQSEKEKLRQQQEDTLHELVHKFHRNKMLMLQASQQEVQALEESARLQRSLFQMQIRSLKQHIERLSLQNGSLVAQATVNEANFYENLKQSEIIIEELRSKLAQIHRIKQQEIEILKVKTGSLHEQNLRSVQDIYAPKLEFLSQKLQGLEDQISKLHDLLAKQLEKNAAMVRKMRTNDSKHSQELMKMKMMYENAEELMRQKFFSEKSLIMQQSAQAIKHYEMKACGLQFYEEELRKLRKQLDDQITSKEQAEKAFEEQRKLWETERQELLLHNKNIAQNADQTARQLKSLIDFKSSQIDNLSKQILKSIRETPLPDYSKYIEEIQSLKKELLEKQEIIRSWKEKSQRAEKRSRECQEQLEKLNLENDVIVNEAKAQWQVLSQRRIDELEEFYKKKLEYADEQNRQLRELNGELQNKITQLVVKYKQLEGGFGEMMGALERRSEMEQRVILLGTDINLVKNKQQLFEY